MQVVPISARPMRDGSKSRSPVKAGRDPLPNSQNTGSMPIFHPEATNKTIGSFWVPVAYRTDILPPKIPG
jgi:hypothetical protein